MYRNVSNAFHCVRHFVMRSCILFSILMRCCSFGHYSATSIIADGAFLRINEGYVIQTLRIPLKSVLESLSGYLISHVLGKHGTGSYHIRSFF